MVILLKSICLKFSVTSRNIYNTIVESKYGGGRAEIVMNKIYCHFDKLDTD